MILLREHFNDYGMGFASKGITVKVIPYGKWLGARLMLKLKTFQRIAWSHHFIY